MLPAVAASFRIDGEFEIVGNGLVTVALTHARTYTYTYTHTHAHHAASFRIDGEFEIVGNGLVTIPGNSRKVILEVQP